MDRATQDQYRFLKGGRKRARIKVRFAGGNSVEQTINYPEWGGDHVDEKSPVQKTVIFNRKDPEMLGGGNATKRGGSWYFWCTGEVSRANNRDSKRDRRKSVLNPGEGRKKKKLPKLSRNREEKRRRARKKKG